MASVSTLLLRSPVAGPHQHQTTSLEDQQSTADSSCPLRRSRSRVFYDSEISTGTSWEFRGIQSSSPQIQPNSLAPTSNSPSTMQISVLRSPVLLEDQHHLQQSPLHLHPQADQTTSSSFRDIIPSPTRDDLGGNGSDGSRNSTGSSSGGSHRSQDSGFSDSGEAARPSRRNMNSSVKDSTASQRHSSNLQPPPPTQQPHNNNSHHHHSNSRSNNNNNPSLCTLEDCCREDSNLNKNTTTTTTTPSSYRPHYHQHHHPRSLSFQIAERLESPPSYTQPPDPPVYHERCYSSLSVPSPIPHSGSGCGKIVLVSSASRNCNNTTGSSSTRTSSIASSSSLSPPTCPRSNVSSPVMYHHHHHHQLHPRSDLNGNMEYPSSPSPNCIYQEVPSRQSSPPINYQHHYQNRQAHLLNSSLNGRGSSSSSVKSCSNLHSNLSVHQGGGGEIPHHLGVPVCSSTPKRSNVSTSRLTIMQKIDNFESLNKNQKSLDNNNNSSSSTSRGNNTSSSNSSSSISGKNFDTVVVIGSHGGSSHGTSCHTASKYPSSYDSPRSSKKSSCSNKKPQHQSSSSSKLSLSSSSNCSSSNQHYHHHHQSSSGNEGSSTTGTTATGSTTTTTTMNFSSTGNRTVLRRSEVKSATSNAGDEENNNINNLSLNESSQLNSKGEIVMMRESPRWESLPKGYKRVPLKGINNSSVSEEAWKLNSSTMGNSDAERVIIVKSHFDNDAMRLWLHELRSQTEPECLHLLQTKTILPPETDTSSKVTATSVIPSSGGGGSSGTCSNSETESGRTSSEQTSSSSGPIRGDQPSKRKKTSVVDAIHAISSPMMSIKNVERMANVVSGEFAKICK
jgi:hypothetical protein